MSNMIPMLATATTMPMSERLAYAVRMLVVGLGMVFVVLAILWGVLVLSRIVLYDAPKRRKDEKEKMCEAVARAAAPEAAVADVAVAPAPAPAVADDGALIAVITAAISAAMAEEGTLPAGGFRVVSFRRASGNRTWNGK